MPVLTSTVDDTSPIIVYSGDAGGDWSAGSSSNDTALDQYSQSSYMFSHTNGSSVSFSFYGTGVQIFGAKRPDHGNYQITIDSLTYPVASGVVSKGSGVFQTSLFSTVALNLSYHKVVMMNLGSTALDIDFITWETPVGQDSEPLVSSIFQDSHSSFTYSPESQWDTTPENLGMFSGGSGHETSFQGGNVTFSFKVSDFRIISICAYPSRSAVQLFGPVGPNGAPYSVQLDGTSPANYSTFKASYRPQTMLFQASNLNSDSHTLLITSQASSNSGKSLAIDYAEVFSTTNNSHKNLSTAAFVGIGVGGLVVILLLLFFIFWRAFPSQLSKVFGLKRRSKIPRFSTEVTAYRPLLQQNTPQSTITSPGLFHAITFTNSDNVTAITSNTQVATIPFTRDGKYRSDLQPTPQSMPPLSGRNRSSYPSRSSFGQTTSRSSQQLSSEDELLVHQIISNPRQQVIIRTSQDSLAPQNETGRQPAPLPKSAVR